MKKTKVILLFLLLISGMLHAQQKDSINFKEEIIIDGKRYRIWNNWVDFGYGAGYHSKNPRTQQAVDLNFNFRIKKYYFRFGGMLSGDEFGLWNNYQIHGGWVPFRRENENRHIAAIAALSYSTGYKFIYAGHYANDPYKEFGFYGELQYIRKVQYSVGLGAAFFVDVNAKNTITGIKLKAFLSGAYQGYAKKHH
ncbi:MAG: hypothetical protein Fur0041_01200 [Bacteroidia bacterium]